MPGAASVILNTAGTIRDSDAPNSEDWEGCRFKWLGHQDSNLDSWNQNPESCRWTTAQEEETLSLARKFFYCSRLFRANPCPPPFLMPFGSRFINILVFKKFAEIREMSIV